MSGKPLNCYFVVYSPKEFNTTVADLLLPAVTSSPVAYVTDEWGANGNHQHRNYLFYTGDRDAYNLARRYKLKAPLWRVKACTSPNNVLVYMTKEVSVCVEWSLTMRCTP